MGQLLNKPQGLITNEPSTGASDFLEKFPALARMNSRSLLGSHSSSPVDSETSGFSSGSDHLSDLLVSWLYDFAWNTCYLCILTFILQDFFYLVSIYVILLFFAVLFEDLPLCALHA